MGLTQRVDNKAKTLSKPRFEILRSLQSGLNITDISRVRKVSRTSVYKIINSLMKIGFLERVGYSYTITTKGIEGLHSFVGLRYNLRQHNFSIKFKVLESPKNWEKKRNEFRKLPFFNRTLKLRNNEQQLLNYGNLTIRTTTKSIIIKIPTIYAKTLDLAILQTFDILETTYPKIENLFKVKLVKNYKSTMQIISQEYAILDDALARVYSKRDEQLLITGSDGKIWMITDKSFKGDEREYIHTTKAPDDEEAISQSLNILREEPQIMKENQKQIANLNGVFPAMKEYNKNLKLHIKVQEAQLETQNELKELIQSLKDKL